MKIDFNKGRLKQTLTYQSEDLTNMSFHHSRFTTPDSRPERSGPDSRFPTPDSRFPLLKKHLFISVIASLLLISFFTSGCRASYGFNNVSIPDSMHTIKVNFIENQAPYRNPQLSPALTEKLRRKITSQTRLSEVKGDNADYDVKATITDYSVSTTGVSDKKVSMNRLTVTVHVTLRDQKASTTQEYDVTWQTEFDANLSLQAAESAVFDTMVRSLSDDIFNRMFSNW